MWIIKPLLCQPTQSSRQDPYHISLKAALSVMSCLFIFLHIILVMVVEVLGYPDIVSAFCKREPNAQGNVYNITINSCRENRTISPKRQKPLISVVIFLFFAMELICHGPKKAFVLLCFDDSIVKVTGDQSFSE